MPKTYKHESVLHDWVHGLTFQMQALLMTGVRGPDENNKHNTAKAIVRYLRGAVIKPAGDWRGKNDNDFMWGDYSKFRHFKELFWSDHDEYPHHFIMHLSHCAEIIGTYHPHYETAAMWEDFYLESCHAFHMNPETREQLEKRLDDFGCGYSG